MTDEASRANLTKSIIEHLYCSGYSDIAKTLENESKIDLYSGDTKKKELFIELATMITAIRNGDFETSLSWIQQNRDKINPSSHFEWKIRRCQYCRMLLDKESKLEDLIAMSWGGRLQNEKATNCRFCRIFCSFFGGDKKLQTLNEKATICSFFCSFLPFHKDFYGF